MILSEATAVKKYGWLLGLCFAGFALAAEDWAGESEFNDPKPPRLQLEADICHSFLRMRVNRAMQSEYRDKSDDDQWAEMLETFKQEEKEVAKELDNDQTRHEHHFGKKFDTRICGDDKNASTAFERLSSTPPDDPKMLEEYLTLVPEPNLLVAACALRAAAEDQVKSRQLANSLELQKPGGKLKPVKALPKKKKGKASAPPEPTPPPAAAPTSAKLQQLEEGYLKRFGKKIDFAQCEG